MISGILISVIISILVGSQIATTLSTSKELSALRRATQRNQTILIALQARASCLERDLKACARSVEIANRKRALRQKASGDLDIYHGGKVATVKAVFRPRPS
jgi:hypothetical protein